jgi:serine/threonine-protein kinase
VAGGVAFGRYRLLRRLARGGMAEVFLAHHIGDDGVARRVAVKRILPHLSDSEQFRKMIVDEAQIAARLSHPHVVYIYDYGRIGEYDFIAMEYVDGVELGQLIRRGAERPVPLRHSARIIADVCAGLHHAHNLTDDKGRRYDLVHRDVSPQNVLVGYDGVVKLVDFGIAKIAWLAGATRPGMVKGKFAYMSPEQVSGRPLDARSDVFAAGICFYELLTGVPLFRRDDPKRAMRDIKEGKPLELARLRPDLPAALVAVVERALQIDRERRYPSAAAMRDDLERYLGAGADDEELGEWLEREVPRAFTDDEDPDLDEAPVLAQAPPPVADDGDPEADPTAEHDAPFFEPAPEPALAPAPSRDLAPTPLMQRAAREPPPSEGPSLVWQIVAGTLLAAVLIALIAWLVRGRETGPLQPLATPDPVIPQPVVVPYEPPQHPTAAAPPLPPSPVRVPRHRRPQ